MSKTLIKYNNGNKRRVIFEKHQLYYYRVAITKDGKRGMCLESCAVHGRAQIGSAACSGCKHNLGHNDKEHFVICKKITEVLAKMK